MPEEAKSFIGGVGIDTNIDNLCKLKSIKRIRSGLDHSLRDLLLLYPEYSKWFPLNRFIVNRGFIDPVSQICAVGRLVLAAAAQGNSRVLHSLEQEIDRILLHNGLMQNPLVDVYIEGSITGGTGAGIFESEVLRVEEGRLKERRFCVM